MSLPAGLEGLNWRSWRSWPGRIRARWRSSLQFRTVTITVLLSGFAIVLVGGPKARVGNVVRLVVAEWAADEGATTRVRGDDVLIP